MSSAQVHRCLEGAPTTLALMIGNTDTRWYWGLSQNIYRMSPMLMPASDMAMFHGLNERVSADNLARMTHFYTTLLERSDEEL